MNTSHSLAAIHALARSMNEVSCREVHLDDLADATFWLEVYAEQVAKPRLSLVRVRAYPVLRDRLMESIESIEVAVSNELGELVPLVFQAPAAAQRISDIRAVLDDVLIVLDHIRELLESKPSRAEREVLVELAACVVEDVQDATKRHSDLILELHLDDTYKQPNRDAHASWVPSGM